MTRKKDLFMFNCSRFVQCFHQKP